MLINETPLTFRPLNGVSKPGRGEWIEGVAEMIGTYEFAEQLWKDSARRAEAWLENHYSPDSPYLSTFYNRISGEGTLGFNSLAWYISEGNEELGFKPVVLAVRLSNMTEYTTKIGVAVFTGNPDNDIEEFYEKLMDLGFSKSATWGDYAEDSIDGFEKAVEERIEPNTSTPRAMVIVQHHKQMTVTCIS